MRPLAVLIAFVLRHTVGISRAVCQRGNIDCLNFEQDINEEIRRSFGGVSRCATLVFSFADNPLQQGQIFAASAVYSVIGLLKGMGLVVMLLHLQVL